MKNKERNAIREQWFFLAGNRRLDSEERASKKIEIKERLWPKS